MVCKNRCLSNISCQTVFVADIPFRFTVRMLMNFRGGPPLETICMDHTVHSWSDLDNQNILLQKRQVWTSLILVISKRKIQIWMLSNKKVLRMYFEIWICFYRLSRREKDTFKPFCRRQTIRESNKFHKIKLAKKEKSSNSTKIVTSKRDCLIFHYF